MLNILWWIISGFFIGAIARFLVPGRDPMGCLGTILLGIAGSVVGGFLAGLIFGGWRDGFHPAGLIGSIIGGVLLLLVLRRFGRPSI